MDRIIISRTALGLSGLLWITGFAFMAASSSAVAVNPPPPPPNCGTGHYPFPYTDVGGVTDPFCPGIMEAYVTGVSKGTSPTTFSPDETVTRVQMTTFLQRSLDQGLARTSRRAALNQWWTPRIPLAMQYIGLGGFPVFCAADGENIWTSIGGDVVQLQVGTVTVLGPWTAAGSGGGVLVAMGKVFVAGGNTSPGSLYFFFPGDPPGPARLAANNLGDNPTGIAFDGTHLWTTNFSGSVSIITPQGEPPYLVTTAMKGFTAPNGILYDGANIWVTDEGVGTLLKLDPSGAIIQTVTVGLHPQFPVFDGTNIWVPNFNDNSITVVQASTGKVVATIAGDANNNLSGPTAASFDGERVLVTNFLGHSVTVFKAADLSLIANVQAVPSSQPSVACSDGVNFWVPLNGNGLMLRF